MKHKIVGATIPAVEVTLNKGLFLDFAERIISRIPPFK